MQIDQIRANRAAKQITLNALIEKRNEIQIELERLENSIHNTFKEICDLNGAEVNALSEGQK